MKFLDMELDKLWENIVKIEQTKEVNTVALGGSRQVKVKSRPSALQGIGKVWPWKATHPASDCELDNDRQNGCYLRGKKAKAVSRSIIVCLTHSQRYGKVSGLLCHKR